MDDRIQEAINTARNKKVKRGARTEVISMRVSPEELKMIEYKFGDVAGLRDFAVGVTAPVTVDLFIDEFRERLEQLEKLKDELD